MWCILLGLVDLLPPVQIPAAVCPTYCKGSRGWTYLVWRDPANWMQDTLTSAFKEALNLNAKNISHETLAKVALVANTRHAIRTVVAASILRSGQAHQHTQDEMQKASNNTTANLEAEIEVREGDEAGNEAVSARLPVHIQREIKQLRLLVQELSQRLETSEGKNMEFEKVN